MPGSVTSPPLVDDERYCSLAADRAVSLGHLSLSLVRDIGSIASDWQRLERREWTSLHQTLAWCQAWAETRGTSLVAVTGSLGPRILFMLPLEIETSRLAKIARLPGGRFNNINTGLFDESLAPPDAAELAAFRFALVKLLATWADLVILDQVPLSWQGVLHPLAGWAKVENPNHTFQLPLLPSMEATLRQINAKTRRKKFRSQGRKMEPLGGYRYVPATEQSEQHRLLDLFFVQKGSRLQAFGLPDVFASPGVRQFFHRLLDVAPKGSDRPLVLHSLTLKGEHEGHVAAIAGLSRKGGHVICQFSSIDESLCAEASPGELLFWHTIEQSIEDGASIFDFGVGDQPYKRSWCSQETVQHDILLPTSRRGRMLVPMLTASIKLKAAVKRNHRLYALAQRWRARKAPQQL